MGPWRLSHGDRGPSAHGGPGSVVERCLLATPRAKSYELFPATPLGPPTMEKAFSPDFERLPRVWSSHLSLESQSCYISPLAGGLTKKESQ